MEIGHVIRQGWGVKSIQMRVDTVSRVEPFCLISVTLCRSDYK